MIVLERLLRPDFVMIDVGANSGLFTLFAAKRLTAGRVIAIEPCSHAFAQLTQNVALAGLTNVTPIAATLCGQVGSRILDVALQAEGSQGPVLDRPARAPQHDVATTIDDLALPRVDLIKIHLRGSALAALKGAEQTIRRDRPRLIVEVTPETCAEVCALLDPLDYYDLFEIDDVTADLDPLREPALLEGSIDIVALTPLSR